MNKDIRYRTIREYITQFKHFSQDQSGFLSDDTVYSDWALSNFLIQGRAAVLADLIFRGKVLSKVVEQTLPGVELVRADMNEVPCAPPSGCTWLKTKDPLPSDLNIRSVTGIVPSFSNPRFTRIEWDQYQYVQVSRLPSMRKARYYALRDIGEGYRAYFYNDQNLKYLSISGIWADPIEAARFPNCGEVNKDALCNPLNVNFFVDHGLVELIMRKAIGLAKEARAGARLDLQNNDINAN